MYTLEEIVHFPTRGSNTLEIVLTNRLVTRCVPDMGMSYHETTVLTDIEYHDKIYTHDKTKRKIFLWNKVNMEQMKEQV